MAAGASDDLGPLATLRTGPHLDWDSLATGLGVGASRAEQPEPSVPKKGDLTAQLSLLVRLIFVRSKFGLLAVIGVLATLFPGCPAQGVGDPCVPEEEYSPTFSGFSASEVSTESRSFQCQSRLCLVNHFQGRVSCPYGQHAGDNRCKVPGDTEAVSVEVAPQLLERRADDAVYCSCRCAGPDPSARYCDCPSGFSCSPVVPKLSLGQAQLPGSYCIRAGSEYVKANVHPIDVCDASRGDCND